MYSNKLTFRKYATEVKAEVKEAILKARNNKRDLLIVSNTDSGKTTMAVQLVEELNREGITSGIAVPLISIVLNKKGSSDEVIFGSGAKFADHADYSEYGFLTVYNTYSNHLQDSTQILFCDEPQTLIQQSNIRGGVNGDIVESKATKVYLTGSPWMLEQALFCDVLYLDREVPSGKVREARHYTVNPKDTDEAIVERIRKHNKGKVTKVIRINDKKAINRLSGFLRCYGHSVATYYSHGDSLAGYLEENKDYLQKNSIEDLKKGIFNDVDFVLCTSAMDSGVDMVCDREVVLYCIGRMDYERQVRLMPHPIDVKQFSARARDQKHVRAYLIGNYGSINYSSTKWEGQEAMFEELRADAIDQMDYLRSVNTLYQKAERNSELSYHDLVTSMGMTIEERGALEVIDGIKVRIRTAGQAMKYIGKHELYGDIVKSTTDWVSTSATEGYEVNYSLGVEVDSIQEEGVLKPSDLTVVAQVVDSVLKASNQRINIEDFYNDKGFDKKNLDKITKAIESLEITNSNLGMAFRRAIRDGVISKDDYRLLETEGETLKAVLQRYFRVNRNSFIRDDMKVIKVRGLKDTEKPVPTPLMQYLFNNKPEWCDGILD